MRRRLQCLPRNLLVKTRQKPQGLTRKKSALQKQVRFFVAGSRLAPRDIRTGGFGCGVTARDAIGRVGNAFAADTREGCQLVSIAARGRHDVLDSVAANRERVRDKRAMAAPGN